jgi:hypothetical protein
MKEILIFLSGLIMGGMVAIVIVSCCVLSGRISREEEKHEGET